MIDVVKVKTGNKFEEHGSYSRLVAVDNLIFVSNTAGRNPQTKEIPEDVTEQTLQVLRATSKRHWYRSMRRLQMSCRRACSSNSRRTSKRS